MSIENELMTISECESLCVCGKGSDGQPRKIKINSDQAQIIIDHMQHTIKTYGSYRNRMRIVNGEIENE